MGVTVVQAETRAFGRKRPEHIVILASGDKIRHMTVRPWMAALAFCTVAVFSIGYLTATTYLVVRDDLIGGAMTRQAQMQHEYEDRISALRAQLDRVTSRQLMDQQMLEEKVEKLLEQQEALASRHGRLGPLFVRAEQSGLRLPSPAAPPTAEKEEASLGQDGIRAIEALLGQAKVTVAPTELAYAPLRESMPDGANDVVTEVTSSLKNLEREQLSKIAGLTVDAGRAADAIAGIMKRSGVDVNALVEGEPAQERNDGLGGPFVEPQAAGTAFDESLDGLEAALRRLESVRETARSLPYGNPAPGRTVTSRYGNRIDPFLGRLALHAGIDFQANTGQEVVSTGAGTVVGAEFSGGYGNMVEIDHGHGIMTRYGHLSRMLVSRGDKVAAGDVIGRAGSTGRSTGPHVHYEVRRDGSTIDPMHFLNAGMKLDTYLN